MEHPNVHLTPQKTYIQQDVREINNPPPHAESVISEPAQGGINILTLSTLLSNKVIGKVRDILSDPV